jgi:hypothetical protein
MSSDLQTPEEEAIYGTGELYHEPNAFVTKVMLITSSYLCI